MNSNPLPQPRIQAVHPSSLNQVLQLPHESIKTALPPGHVLFLKVPQIVTRCQTNDESSSLVPIKLASQAEVCDDER
ncbi:hypothetical protein BM1_05657 [Bipolaris maydis]|nr:hypothetical protein BM1_05657 [Bipolaris maydis]